MTNTPQRNQDLVELVQAAISKAIPETLAYTDTYDAADSAMDTIEAYLAEQATTGKVASTDSSGREIAEWVHSMFREDGR